MPGKNTKYQLPRSIEHHLAALSKLYGKEGQVQLQEILVNAQIRVHEEWTSVSWNGGTYGHAIYLALPERIFLGTIRGSKEICEYIKTDLNKIHNVPNEFIADVFLEMQPIEDQDWRMESGLLLAGVRRVTDESQQRIWGETGYRIFLSHKTGVKKETAGLKEKLRTFGASCFVAHEDIHPTKAWQDEIENALTTMDAFVALLTEDFHDSLWTDQEVGFALGRGVPILAVKLGKDPYGFIGKFQALSCGWKEAPLGIAKLLATEPGMLDAYITAASQCPSFAVGNELAELLPAIQRLSDSQADHLCAAFNNNAELRGCFGFNGIKPRDYGDGLEAHLKRITGKTFQRSEEGIQRVGS